MWLPDRDRDQHARESCVTQKSAIVSVSNQLDLIGSKAETLYGSVSCQVQSMIQTIGMFFHLFLRFGREAADFFLAHLSGTSSFKSSVGALKW